VYEAETAAFVDFDFEVGGEKVGVISIGAVITDTSSGLELGRYYRVIKPTNLLDWNMHEGAACHGFFPSHPEIVAAAGLVTVWKDWMAWIRTTLQTGGVDRTGIWRAWNGKSCDCKWLFTISEVWHKGVLSLPDNCPYFIDPMRLLHEYKGDFSEKTYADAQKHHPGHSLSAIYKEAFGTTFEDTHNALADAVAQRDLCAHDGMKGLMDKNKSVQRIEEVFAVKAKKGLEMEAELTRKIPPTWNEGAGKVDSGHTYHAAPSGGATHGPTSKVTGFRSTLDIWLFLFPLDTLETVAEETNRSVLFFTYIPSPPPPHLHSLLLLVCSYPLSPFSWISLLATDTGAKVGSVLLYPGRLSESEQSMKERMSLIFPLQYYLPMTTEWKEGFPQLVTATTTVSRTLTRPFTWANARQG
jgi:hypothetical protein